MKKTQQKYLVRIGLAGLAIFVATFFLLLLLASKPAPYTLLSLFIVLVPALLFYRFVFKQKNTAADVALVFSAIFVAFWFTISYIGAAELAKREHELENAPLINCSEKCGEIKASSLTPGLVTGNGGTCKCHVNPQYCIGNSITNDVIMLACNLDGSCTRNGEEREFVYDCASEGKRCINGRCIQP